MKHLKLVTLALLVSTLTGCGTVIFRREPEPEFEWKAASGVSHEQMYRDSEGCWVTVAHVGIGKGNFAAYHQGLAYNHCMQSKGHELVKATVQATK